MSERISLEEIGGADLAPPAIVKTSPEELGRTRGIAFERDADDLDYFSAAFFRSKGWVFAFMRYDGEPPDSLTLYLERRLAPEEAGRAVAAIAKEFDIADSLIVWRETADLRPSAAPPRAAAG